MVNSREGVESGVLADQIGTLIIDKIEAEVSQVLALQECPSQFVSNARLSNSQVDYPQRP